MARILVMRSVSEYEEAAAHIQEHSLGGDDRQLGKAVAHLDKLLEMTAATAFDDALHAISRKSPPPVLGA